MTISQTTSVAPGSGSGPVPCRVGIHTGDLMCKTTKTLAFNKCNNSRSHSQTGIVSCLLFPNSHRGGWLREPRADG